MKEGSGGREGRREADKEHLLFAASLVFHFADIAVRLTVSSANRIEVDGKFFGTFTKWRSTSSQRQAKTVIFTLENMTSICKGIKIPS